jgi:hypothetical protein
MTPRTQIRPDPEPRTQNPESRIQNPDPDQASLPDSLCQHTIPPAAATAAASSLHHHHLRLLILLLLFPYSASPSNLPPTNITSNITSHRITSPRPPAPATTARHFRTHCTVLYRIPDSSSCTGKVDDPKHMQRNSIIPDLCPADRPPRPPLIHSSIHSLNHSFVHC